MSILILPIRLTVFMINAADCVKMALVMMIMWVLEFC